MTIEDSLNKLNEAVNELNKYLKEPSSKNLIKEKPSKNETLAPKSEEIDLVIKNDLKFIEFKNDFEKLKTLLESEDWPEAVDPDGICDPNSENDKTERARGIIEYNISKSLDGTKFLDYGCGEGHCVAFASNSAEVSVGYDINPSSGWENKFDKKNNMIFTNVFENLLEYGPFDNILMFDVLDHLQEENPVEALKKVRSLLKDEGTLYCTVHPFTSKHATHLYRTINKAYLHLVFSEEELQRLFPNIKQEYNLGVKYPLNSYASYFRQAGLQMSGEKSGANYKVEHLESVPSFFKQPLLKNRIMACLDIPGNFPEFQLSVQFIDYVLKKA